jgi:rubredoxin
VYYVVDRDNLIVDTHETWDNDARTTDMRGGTSRECIIGRRLEAFMVGDATKMFVRSALDAARLLGQTRTLPYRCDSAGQHRRFEMVISPLGGGQVRVEHRLLEARPRAQRASLKAPRALPAWRCSQCLFVRYSGHVEWRETDLEPAELLAQDVCPECARKLFDHAANQQE